MSGLEIFEELRFMIELLAAELMFIYYFAKKKGRYNIRMVCGFSGFCVLAVVYIFLKDFTVSIGFQQMIYIVSLGWYVLLLLLSMLFMKLCFEITVSDMLFIGISGYATMHIEYVVVNEILALGLWKELREILWLYIIISIASCIVWYTLVINIFVRKLQSCEGRLYEDTKANIVMFSILFLSMLIATFMCQGIFRGNHKAENVAYSGAVMDLFVSSLILVVQYSAFRINALNREKEIVRQLLYERKKQYQLSKENIEIINHKCHDMKHQLHALKKAESEEVRRYIDEVEDSIMIYDHVVETENEVLNTILSEKSLYCEKHQIKLTCIIDAAPLDFMSTVDIYAILGNALDNAIEAVSKYKDTEKRVISLTISMKNGFLSIQTNNYFEGEMEFENDLPVSTKKKNKAYHGFGMKSIKHLTEKYGGSMYAKLEHEIFTLQIVLPMPKEFLRLLKE